MRIITCVLFLLLGASPALAAEDLVVVDGVLVKDVKVGKKGKYGDLKIPADWTLLTITSTFVLHHLWFQGPDGSIYFFKIAGADQGKSHEVHEHRNGQPIAHRIQREK